MTISIGGTANRYKDGLPYANYNAMSAHLTVLKKTTHRHWRALPSQAIQCELRRIDTAYQRFSRNSVANHISSQNTSLNLLLFREHRVGDKRESYLYHLKNWNETKNKWQNNFVSYSFYKHREFHGKIANITIKRDNCGDCWLCITTDFVDTELLATTGQSVGGDFGMKDAYLTLSTGEKSNTRNL